MNINRLSHEITRLYNNRAQQTREGSATRPTGSSSPASSAGGVGGLRPDTVTISSTLREVMRILQVIKNLPDVREEKVRPLREQVRNGTYRVSEEALASRLVNG